MISPVCSTNYAGAGVLTSPYANLKPNRSSIITLVARPQPLPGLQVNHDALTVAPVVTSFYLVTHPFKRPDCCRGKVLFRADHIRQPLMMKSRSVDGFLNVPFVVHHSHQDVGNSG